MCEIFGWLVLQKHLDVSSYKCSLMNWIIRSCGQYFLGLLLQRFLSCSAGHLCHCAHWQHRNTGLHLLPPGSSPWTSHSQLLLLWLRISLGWNFQSQALLRVWWTRLLPWFSPAAVCTSTSGNSQHPSYVCSLWLRCHPFLSTGWEFVSHHHHFHQLDLLANISWS